MATTWRSWKIPGFDENFVCHGLGALGGILHVPLLAGIIQGQYFESSRCSKCGCAIGRPALTNLDFPSEAGVHLMWATHRYMIEEEP